MHLLTAKLRLRAKRASIKEKVYTGSDGLMSDTVLSKWLKEFDTTKVKAVMQTHATTSAKVLIFYDRQGGKSKGATSRGSGKEAAAAAKLNEWWIGFDLQNGYHVVGIDPAYQEHMQLNVWEESSQCGARPFEWNYSPCIFVEVMQLLVECLRSPRSAADRREVRKLQSGSKVVVAMLSHLTSRNVELMRRMRRLWILLDLNDIALQVNPTIPPAGSGLTPRWRQECNLGRLRVLEWRSPAHARMAVGDKTAVDVTHPGSDPYFQVTPEPRAPTIPPAVVRQWQESPRPFQSGIHCPRINMGGAANEEAMQVALPAIQGQQALTATPEHPQLVAVGDLVFRGDLLGRITARPRGWEAGCRARSAELVAGCKGKVYWCMDNAWCTGTVADTGSDGLTHVAYTDGDEEYLDMSEEKYEANSMQPYLSAINNYHEDMGFTGPAKGRAVSRAVKGMSRLKVQVADAAGAGYQLGAAPADGLGGKDPTQTQRIDTDVWASWNPMAGRCTPCPAGTLSFSNATECIECPEGAAYNSSTVDIWCPGGSDFIIPAGSWLAPSAAHCASDARCLLERVYPCDLADACTWEGGLRRGSSAADVARLHLCNDEQYNGNLLCGGTLHVVCSNGHYPAASWSGKACVACDSHTVVLAQTIGGVLLLFLLLSAVAIAFLLYGAYSSEGSSSSVSRARTSSETAVMVMKARTALSMAIGNMQVVGQTGAIYGKHAPPVFVEMADMFNFLNFDFRLMLKPECLIFRFMPQSADGSSVQAYWAYFYQIMTLPFLVVGITLLIHRYTSRYHSRSPLASAAGPTLDRAETLRSRGLAWLGKARATASLGSLARSTSTATQMKEATFFLQCAYMALALFMLLFLHTGTGTVAFQIFVSIRGRCVQQSSSPSARFYGVPRQLDAGGQQWRAGPDRVRRQNSSGRPDQGQEKA
ncbi:hypothetical protein CYMTET_20120 [Cymbomonas tetramitiformis]|uniref:Uncharacterized protein n=1 Tax=Cymbomonas tetramitiformis TaxID=36881 RepID=A0AAE0G4R4_9CHLO|nr:hypothetical protein CYMTET_20120 [Cymbomonas tetramitiformis]